MKLAIPIFCLSSSLLLAGFAADAADVPFLSQAPLGQWGDLRQAQGCEEAVSLMALAWARDQATIDPKTGRDYIVDMSNWEKRYSGDFVDTSIQDTADRLIKHYIGYYNIKVEHGISTKDIKAELDNDNILIVAIDGRKIGIPYYRNGGPRHHEIIVAGYDTTTDMFIINNPGTARGKGLKLKSSVLQAALQDYPSGDGSSYKTLPSAMIVIYK